MPETRILSHAQIPWRLCAAIALPLALCTLATLPSTAQPPAPAVRFEVASIKPSPPDSHVSIASQLRNGSFTASNVTLREVLAAACGVTANRVIGPDWLDRQRFEFQAKAPAGIPDTQMQPLLRHLLEDRFRLAAHNESRQMAVYDLVVAKGGVKMAIYPAAERPLKNIHTLGFPMVRGTMTAARLASLLSTLAGRPVIDRTNLTDRYNLLLSYSPPFSQSTGNPQVSAPPNLFTAIQEQLGLKLQPNKSNLEVVVVDRIDPAPSEN